MDRKRKTKRPCAVCGLGEWRCFCADLNVVALARTSIELLVHARELKRTTNTGRLATAALQDARLWVRGRPGEALSLAEVMRPDCVKLLLFPAEDAVELTPEFVASLGSARVQLFVPDGNWRQAAKVGQRHPELADVQRVIVRPQLDPNRPVLRQESSPHGMATLQAIAYALCVLESAAVGEHVLRVYETKLARTLEGRPPPERVKQKQT